MKKTNFVFLIAEIEPGVWNENVKPNFIKFQDAFPKAIITISMGYWLIDRSVAEEALVFLTEQIRRFDRRFLVIPVSEPPTIHAEESTLALIADAGCDVYPIALNEANAL